MENAEPPSFYDADLRKWELKFKAARELRQQEKLKLKSLGCFKPLGTKNTNTSHERVDLRRRNSRGSAAAFVAPDFEYSGNTNDF